MLTKIKLGLLNRIATTCVTLFLSSIAFTSTASAEAWVRMWGYAPFQSTYYGGSDAISDIQVDKDGTIYFAGVTNSYQLGGIVLGAEVYTGVVGKMDTHGNLLWSRELGVQRFSNTVMVSMGRDQYGYTYTLGETSGSSSVPESDVVGNGIYEKQVFVVKHDANGNQQWLMPIALSKDLYMPKLSTTNLGYSIITGSRLGTDGVYRVVAYRINYWGNLVGPIEYPAVKSELVTDVTTDGYYYYIAYKSFENSGANGDPYDTGLKRVDRYLSLRWSTRSNQIGWEEPSAVVYNFSNNQIMVFGTNGSSAAVTGFDYRGNFLYQKTYYTAPNQPFIGEVYVKDAVQTANGEILATGSIGKNGVKNNGWGNDILYAKYSATGDPLDVKNIGAYNTRDPGNAIAVDAAGNFYIGGAAGGNVEDQLATPNSGVSKDFIMLKNKP